MNGKRLKSVGILPAAGLGSRWGHFPKFLLPCGDREWLLDRAINNFPCEKVVIAYSQETENELRNHVRRCGLKDRVIFMENKRMDLDFWGSMLAGLLIEADYYYFAMPDTYLEKGLFDKFGGKGITLGVHHTNTPERFGVLRNGIVINKQIGSPGMAWGALGWDHEVRDLWNVARISTYTEAINLALQEFKTNIVNMQYYYDMADYKSYTFFIDDERMR